MNDPRSSRSTPTLPNPSAGVETDEARTPAMLYVSLFDLSLLNFPEGCFSKRVLTVDEARERVAMARAAGRLA
jgi:hypothetical protein